jgi:hypothetical protein
MDDAGERLAGKTKEFGAEAARARARKNFIGIWIFSDSC